MKVWEIKAYIHRNRIADVVDALFSEGFRTATMYEQALAIAPPEDRLPPDLVAPVARARQAVAEKSAALKAHLLERWATSARVTRTSPWSASTKASTFSPARPGRTCSNR
ncbi:MAG: hypothetical protein ACREQ8_02340 [Woeseiaceae bacterium]